MSLASQGQAYQTIAPDWVARALLIDTAVDNPARPLIGDRCWTTDLPETTEFRNELPACVITDIGSNPMNGANTTAITGLMEIRVFGGSRKLGDCWRVWHAIRERLLIAKGKNYTIKELDCRARWLWATEQGIPQQIRKHPATGWPELNCTIQYAVQGIAKET